MHAREVKATVRVSVCQCCGVNFGYEVSEEKVPAYCSAHSWLGRKKYLGVPLLNGIMYTDTQSGLRVTGNNVRWSYYFFEDDPKEREKLKVALEAWVKEEADGKYFMPRVVVTSKGIMVMDLQRFTRLLHGDFIDQDEIGRLLDKMDKIYVEAL